MKKSLKTNNKYKKMFLKNKFNPVIFLSIPLSHNNCKNRSDYQPLVSYLQ